MLLALDIGNTHTVLGLYRGARWVHTWRLATDTARTGDEWGLALRELFRSRSLPSSRLAGAVIGCVVPGALTACAQACEAYLGVSPLIAAPDLDLGLSIRYDPPHSVGIDRVANAVAAAARLGAPVIVADFGTATKLEAVSSPPAAYLGGAILPGVQTAIDALAGRTARLPAVPVALPPGAIGGSTVAAIQAGVLWGTIEAVEGLIRRMREALAAQAPVVATGGFAPLIAPHCRSIGEVEPYLTLEGLRLIYERNRP